MTFKIRFASYVVCFGRSLFRCGAGRRRGVCGVCRDVTEFYESKLWPQRPLKLSGLRMDTIKLTRQNRYIRCDGQSYENGHQTGRTIKLLLLCRFISAEFAFS